MTVSNDIVVHASVRFSFDSYMGAVEALLLVVEDARTTYKFYTFKGLTPGSVLRNGLLLEGQVDDIVSRIERIHGCSRISE